jgi:hypothetical protein
VTRPILLLLAIAAAAAWAQAPAATLAPDTTIKVELEKKLDSKKAKVGQPVRVKVEQEIKDHGAVVLPKNCYLVGTVTEDAPAAKGKMASVGVLFTSAQTKKGAPVAAHFRAAFVKIYADRDNTYGMLTMPAEMGGNYTPPPMTGGNGRYGAYDKANGKPVEYSVLDSYNGVGPDLGGEIVAVTSGDFHIDSGTKLQVRILH